MINREPVDEHLDSQEEGDLEKAPALRKADCCRFCMFRRWVAYNLFDCLKYELIEFNSNEMICDGFEEGESKCIK